MRSLRRVVAPAATVLSVLLICLVLPAPARATGAWTVVPSPNEPGIASQQLAADTCVTAAFCMAVGSYSDGEGEQRPLTEVRQNAVWSVVPAPGFGSLYAISCVAASGCIAVGTTARETFWSDSVKSVLVMVWNGLSWSAAPLNMSGVLKGVSCTGPAQCTAVGYAAGPTGARQTLILASDGSSWNPVASPDEGAGDNVLNAVSCLGTSFCEAAGYSTSGGVTQTLIENWAGGTWSAASSPDPGNTANVLNGVSCTSTTSCTAVGYDTIITPTTPAATNQGPLVEALVGSTWQFEPVEDGSAFTDLSSVSCATTVSCTAVGTGDNGVLVESGAGPAWVMGNAVSASPAANCSQCSALLGVTCLSAASCLAVGWYFNGDNADLGLVEQHSSVGWALSPATVQQTMTSDILQGVSCPSTDSCTAVGQFINSGGETQALIETWDGSSWSAVPTANSFNLLDGVSCPTVQMCMAVGWVNELWNGSTWTAVPRPAGVDQAQAVSCTSPTFCAAVGYGGAAGDNIFAETWNGSVWTVVPSQDPDPGFFSELNGVSCVSPSDCVAVGTSRASTLVEQWDGTSWTVVPSPDGTIPPPAGTSDSNALLGVSCVAANACTAVGYQSGADVTLTEQWDGTSWVVDATNPPADGILRQVACPVAGACTAVGFAPTGSQGQTLVDTQSASGWSQVASPDLAPNTSSLSSLSCPDTTSCTAVGDEVDANDNLLTLVATG